MRTEPFDRLLRGASAPDPRTLVDVLRQVCETFPDAPALDNGAEVLTYRELEEAAEGVAEYWYSSVTSTMFERAHHVARRPTARAGAR